MDHETPAPPALIPYEQVDRTPDGPLKSLHMFAAAQLGIHPDLLVSLRGQVAEHGSIILFGRNEHPADTSPAGYVVASFHGDEEAGRRFQLTHRAARPGAEDAYDLRLGKLS